MPLANITRCASLENAHLPFICKLRFSRFGDALSAKFLELQLLKLVIIPQNSLAQAEHFLYGTQRLLRCFLINDDVFAADTKQRVAQRSKISAFHVGTNNRI